jgi:hypothetical protein
MSAAAFSASYCDWKLVRTRQVVQIVFEVDLAAADMAYKVLGGMPEPGKESHFAIAALNVEQSEPQRREWREVQPSAQAAMRCDQPEFWAFLREERQQRVANKDDAATAVRKLCNVNSRAHFNNNESALKAWHKLDDEFRAWKLVNA